MTDRETRVELKLVLDDGATAQQLVRAVSEAARQYGREVAAFATDPDYVPPAPLPNVGDVLKPKDMERLPFGSVLIDGMGEELTKDPMDGVWRNDEAGASVVDVNKYAKAWRPTLVSVPDYPAVTIEETD